MQGMRFESRSLTDPGSCFDLLGKFQPRGLLVERLPAFFLTSKLPPRTGYEAVEGPNLRLSLAPKMAL